MPLDQIGTGDRQTNNVVRLAQIQRSPDGSPVGGSVDAASALANHRGLLERAAGIALGSARIFKEGCKATLQLQNTRHRSFLGEHNADGTRRPERVEAILQVGGAVFTVGRFEGSRFVPSDLLVHGRAEAKYYDDPINSQKFTKVATSPRVSGLSESEAATLCRMMEGLAWSADNTRTLVSGTVRALVG